MKFLVIDMVVGFVNQTNLLDRMIFANKKIKI